jgi:hypothetical protein
MKSVMIITMLALLDAGLSRADDFIATNQMPKQIHRLMETEGYRINQASNAILLQTTNSLRDFGLIKNARLVPLEIPAKKAGWNFWDNTSIKYVGRNTDPISILAPTKISPYTALSQYEYDITYSFDF